MNKSTNKFSIGGKFYYKHYRDGKLIAEEDLGDNLFVDEGLVYVMNSSLAVSVNGGGAPNPLSNLYIGITKANRAWNAGDEAATIAGIADEFQLYNEASRPAWIPQNLATAGTVELSNETAEAVFTINTATTIYGAMIISASPKDASQDGSATLICGRQFDSPRPLQTGDVFKVGYVLGVTSNP